MCNRLKCEYKRNLPAWNVKKICYEFSYYCMVMLFMNVYVIQICIEMKLTIAVK